MSVVEMSFDLSDTAAAYCDATVGALSCTEVVLCCTLSGSCMGQTEIRPAFPSTEFTDTKEVQFFSFSSLQRNGDERR